MVTKKPSAFTYLYCRATLIILLYAYVNNSTNILRKIALRFNVISYQLKLIKKRAELAGLNYCAVPFLSRAAVNLC